MARQSDSAESIVVMDSGLLALLGPGMTAGLSAAPDDGGASSAPE
jgi:hypothetical protein